MSGSIPADRPRQDTPDALIFGLLAYVRGQFCGDLSDREWGQQTHFLRRNVILWPARFMWGKGFTLPAARYDQILRSIFADVIRHGRAGAVRYWPGYLMHVVQEHFRHNWEDYYQEAKSMRSQAMALIARCKPVPAEDRTVEALALAHQALTSRRRAARPAARPAKQLGLFGLD